MSKPKSSKNAPAKPESEAEAPAADIEITATSLSKVQKAFLQRVSRFLVNIQSAKYSGRAAKNGYKPSVHAEGWKLWSVASGMTRPLDHWFSEQERSGELSGVAGDTLRLLQELDAFENTWFPRVRAIIRHKVPRDRRDAFAAAFFTNLVQQPLGPMVVGSVRALLQRIEELKNSKEPGAEAVFQTLRERGLTTKKVAEVRAKLEEAEQGSQAAPKKTGVTPEELAEAQAAQQEAYESLKDWFNDWGTMLRPSFNASEQLVLGLAIRRKRGPSAGEILDEEEEIAGEEGADEPMDGEDDEPAAAPAKVKSAAAKATSGEAKGNG